LQGVKRGIMEMADMILVNKADGDLKPAANRTCSDYAGALRLLRKRPQDPQGFPKAMTVSALEEDGLKTAWDEMQTLVDWRREHGFFEGRRAEQARYWFDQEVRQALLARLETRAARETLARLGDDVAQGRAVAQRGDDACSLGAGNERKRRLGLVFALDKQDVREVHPGGLHVDHDKAFRERRLVDLGDLKIFVRSEFLTNESAHASLLPCFR